MAGDGAAALKCLLVLGPAIASRIARVPSVFDVAFTVALASEAIGSALAAHNGVEWPDEASHLVIPFLSAPVVYEILVRLDAALVPERAGGAHPYVGAGIVTAVGVLALGAIWEVVEWGADGALGTDYSQGYADTLSDLLADAIAAAVGGVVVAIWQRARAQATRAERSPASAGRRYRDAA